jgi:CRP-like cAMP-binding protein
LAVDGVLALKFYRNLASKLASIFFTLNGNCIACFQKQSASESSSPAMVHQAPADFDPSRRFSAAAIEFGGTRKKRARLVNSAHLSYKVYALASNGNVTRVCKIKKQRIKLVSEAFGFKKKKTIEFSQIKHVSQSSPTSVTILFGNMKARTMFFKDVAEVNEFMGLLNSIITQSSAQNLRSTSAGPLSQPPKERTLERKSSSTTRHPSGFFSLNTDNDSDYEDDEDQADTSVSSSFSSSLTSDEDRDVVRRLADKVVLKRGDVLIAEGDLYQRLYSLTQGTCDVCANGMKVSEIPEGMVFGEASLLHLRPSPVTMIVSSEEATVLIIPAYRLFKLTESDPFLSARLYRKASQLLENKIMWLSNRAKRLSGGITCPVATTDHPAL